MNKHLDRIEEELRNLVKQRGSFADKSVLQLTQRVGKYLAENRLASGKLRNYFHFVKTLYQNLENGLIPEERAVAELYKFKARVSYDAARRVQGVSAFKPVADIATEVLLNSKGNLGEKLRDFVDFLECVVGYHYFYSTNKSK